MTSYRTGIRVSGVLGALAVLLVAGCGEGPGEGVVFEDVTVIDAVHGVREHQRVRVSGQRIESVTAIAGDPPPAARVIDGRGRYLIPGLWDMHVHFLYDEALTDGMAALFLAHGVTSVRDTGGDLARLIALREQLESGSAPGPRVFVSGPLLDGRHVVYDGGDPGRPALGVDVASPEAAARRVGELEAGGADFIKIYELVTPEVFAALVAEARARGLPIAAHVPLTLTADVAGPQVDSMEHLRNVELACAADWVELLAARREQVASFEAGRGYDLRSAIHAAQRLAAIAAYDERRCDTVLDALGETIQVPTLRLNAFALARPDLRDDWPETLSRLPPEVVARWAGELGSRGGDDVDTTFAEWSLFLVGEMRRHGVPIGAGTDTPIGLAVPGYSLHTELTLLVSSGLSPLEALEAATLTPARFFGLESRIGTVAAGMAADLVLLDKNPLSDIDNTRGIAGVMRGGVWLPDRDGGPDG